MKALSVDIWARLEWKLFVNSPNLAFECRRVCRGSHRAYWECIAAKRRRMAERVALRVGRRWMNLGFRKLLQKMCAMSLIYWARGVLRGYTRLTKRMIFRWAPMVVALSNPCDGVHISSGAYNWIVAWMIKGIDKTLWCGTLPPDPEKQERIEDLLARCVRNPFS